MICRSCGSANPSGASFCNHCGTPLTAAMPTSSSGASPVPSGASIVSRPQPVAVTAEAAKISLGLGLAASILCGFPTGIPAILVGRRAITKIRQSQGRLKGREIAMAGIILGYASCALWLVFLIGGYFLFRTAVKQIDESEASAISAIRQINEAEASYSQIYSGSSGNLYAGSLAALGPGPQGTCSGTGTRENACLLSGPLVRSDCREPRWCILKGYKFQLQVHYSSKGSDYAITAVPEGNGNGGTKNFCSTSDGVVRSEVRFGNLLAGYNTDECLRLIPVPDHK